MDTSKMSNNRRRNYARYEKPQWEIEKERAERERQEAIERGLKNTEENFPALGSGAPKQTAWGGRKFNELAAEWKQHDDERKIEEEYTKKDDTFTLPVFQPRHYFVEEDEDMSSQPPPRIAEPEDNGWTTVDRTKKMDARLVRREARQDERLRRMDEGIEPDSDENEEIGEDEESCWNQVAPIGKQHA